jgi:hypothetical protein
MSHERHHLIVDGVRIWRYLNTTSCKANLNVIRRSYVFIDAISYNCNYR